MPTDLQNPTGTPVNQASPAELAANVAALRNSLHVVLMMLLVMTCGLNIFLFRQVAMARRQASEAAEYVANYQKTTEPAIARFVAQLQTYAKTHPDFVPILSKYAALNPQSGPGGLPLPPGQ